MVYSLLNAWNRLNGEVNDFAMSEVESGEITAEQYKEYIGEEYPVGE